MTIFNMEQFSDYTPFIIRPNVADEYLHRVVCAPKKKRSGSTPYANKRNKKCKNKPKRK